MNLSSKYFFLLFAAAMLPCITLICSRPVGDNLPEFILMDVLAPPEYTIGGKVTGLLGQNLILGNGDDSVIISASDSDLATVDYFTFPQKLRTLDNYNIFIQGYPRNPAQFCELNLNTCSGVVINNDIEDLEASCQEAYLIKVGSVSGLSGSGLTLQNNGGDNLLIDSGAIPTEFHTPVLVGSTNDITIAADPTNPWQTCLFNGTNTSEQITISLAQDEYISDIICSTNQYDVIASIANLLNPNFILNFNGVDQAVAAGTTSHNAGTLNSGDTFNLVVSSQPNGQNCAIAGGSGTIKGANIYPSISCATIGYLVGGNIANLDGTGLALQLRDSSENVLQTIFPVTGSYIFSSSLSYGSTYSISIVEYPTNPWQTCSFDAGGTEYYGAGLTANKTDIDITCITNDYSVGGTISGLNGDITLRLLDDGANVESKTLSSNGSFAFTNSVQSGHTYRVEVEVGPVGQTCSIANASAVVAGSDITNVSVICPDQVVQGYTSISTDPATFRYSPDNINWTSIYSATISSYPVNTVIYIRFLYTDVYNESTASISTSMALDDINGNTMAVPLECIVCFYTAQNTSVYSGHPLQIYWATGDVPPFLTTIRFTTPPIGGTYYLKMAGGLYYWDSFDGPIPDPGDDYYWSSNDLYYRSPGSRYPILRIDIY